MPVQTMYEDGYNYQNILAPLVRLEAEYDRRLKENQGKADLSVRWDTGLSKKRIAIFSFPLRDDSDLRLVVGDELKLRLDPLAARLNKKPWEGTGHVLWLDDGEVALEMRSPQVPTGITEGE
jgi:regulator of nonsense transcripts 1